MSSLRALRAKTRRLIAKITLAILVIITFWILLPNDIGEHEKTVAIALIGFANLYLMAFAGFETANDHSERKHAKNPDQSD